MNSVLQRNLFFVKEHPGVFKAANNFDVFDPHSGEMIMVCREEKLGIMTKILRFTDYKTMTPFHIEVRTASGDKVLTIKRGVSFFLSTVEVFDENDALVGRFKQKLFTIGGKFDVLAPDNRVLCTLKGKWTSWEFAFIQNEQELAKVSKKWAGLGRELFTSADNYMLEIRENVAGKDTIRILILAAVMCIDMVLKE